ncbi:uncharacterized protein [Dysidea avara]|uniref:uncharacterized protein n=1 Tax=Dysidea avara TaxID=196820 RepID=UPI00332DE33E
MQLVHFVILQGLILIIGITYADGQTCTDSVNVHQIGEDRLSTSGGVAIVPRLNFTCNGRILNIRVRVLPITSANILPYIQIWRPSSSVTYDRVGQVQIQTTQLTRPPPEDWLEANIPLTGSNRLQFQSGDVIGFYHPSDFSHEIRTTRTDGYVLRQFVGRYASSLALGDANNTLDNRQPLIQFEIDIQCNNIATPSSGEITSCSSGSMYEGDTCSFTCNTGYGLTGSDTRTCQSDGSWSGSETMCRRVPCPLLTDPNSGTITCSLGDDGVPSYEDTCSVTCDTGYELIGSDTRTCQSNGGWSGIETMCSRVPCPSLTDRNNVTISCSLGDDGVPSYEDTCSFTCNTGYELSGSDNRTCQSDGNWSGAEAICRRVPCPSLTNPNNGTITCSLGDDGIPSFEDTCTFPCNTGYELTGSDTRTCQSDGSWSGSDDVCRRVPCSSLTEPNNGTITCSLGDDGVLSYEDSCSFTCNTGYVLTGNGTRTCQSDGSWSDDETICTDIQCNNLTTPSNGEITSCSSGSIGVGYERDTCSFTCSTGYELTGSGTRTCQSDRNWSGDEVMCNKIKEMPQSDSSSSGGSSGGLSIAVISGIIGGVVVAIIIIVVLVVVIVWMRRSQRGKADTVYNDSANGADVRKEESSFINKNNKESVDIESMLAVALPEVPDAYDEVVSYDKSRGIYYMSSQDVAKSLQTEKQIYGTPCNNKQDYGPIYCSPSDDETKLYQEFEGKKFQNLCHKEMKVCEKLGSGEFGVVARAIWKPSSHKKVEVAVKTLNANVNTKDRVRFLQEAAIMCQFDHENVVKLHGVMTDEPVMIILEYVSRGDLRNVLIQLQPSGGGCIPTKLPVLLLKFCQEIAAGMTYLNGKQFVHRDLAARNILVSESVTCKIADFGMSRDLLDENYYVTSGGKIPVKWTAPEAIHYRKYSGQSDVWSYGIVLYEIWSLGCEPYEWLTIVETIEKVDTGYRLPPPPGCPRAIYRVMIKCWNPEPKSRPQFGQITQLLSGNHNYLLGWSDEDKQYGGEEAMKLGGRAECTNDLYYDLQLQYNRKGCVNYLYHKQ